MTEECFKDAQECQRKIEALTKDITKRQLQLLANIDATKQDHRSTLASLEKQRGIYVKKMTDLDQEIRELLLTKENMIRTYQQRDDELRIICDKNEYLCKENDTLRDVLSRKNKIKNDLENERNILMHKVKAAENLRKEKEAKYSNRANIVRKALDCNIVAVKKEVTKFSFGTKYFVMDFTSKTHNVIECQPYQNNLAMYNEKYKELNNLYTFVVWMKMELDK